MVDMYIFSPEMREPFVRYIDDSHRMVPRMAYT